MSVRIVIVGAGFAGFHAARGLAKHAPEAEVVLVNPTDYFPSLPLLPEVGSGNLEPRRICVSLPDRLPHARLVLATVTRVDVDGRRIEWADAEGRPGGIEF